ncbi:outer membrane lipoprotein-sorting protein [Methanococcoides seepicolus]|uniref:Outer membrane lipoprotein-sorting protein n=1 Tax=Methanococcoides seepicolus TaxID=2828780 RepID=A0A9E4ZHM2_9EURY|nr:outer membrane lipoprotein-sorting protein [Methanococcoides seepicolus]MCM1987680.1 outer membrane lipoprotein-sorting protein [Methanococcoides seepicolus]
MNTQKLTLILLITSLLLFSAGCIGEELTAAQIAEEYKQKQANIEDYSATMYMTTYLGEQEITSITSMSQKMPDKTKTTIIQAEQGEGMVMVSNGKTMWTYNPDQNSVMVMNLGSMGDFDASQMDYTGMMQDLLDENDLTLDAIDTVDGRDSYVISIKPNDNSTSGLVVDMKTWIDKETWMPLKFEMYDDEGNLMIVTEYRDFEVNTGIPDSEFEFEIPEGAEVVTFDSLEDLIPEEVTLEEAQELSEYDVLVPSYIPEGYEFEDATVNNNTQFSGEIQEIVSITYSKDFESLHIREIFYEEESPTIMENGGKIVDINGYEGQLVSSPLGDDYASLSWNKGNTKMIINGPVGSDELIKIAESME